LNLLNQNWNPNKYRKLILFDINLQFI